VKVTVEFVTVPREGERDNGDAAVVRRSEDGVLIAVIDALGHGRHAAEAAVAGIRYLEEAPLQGGIRRVVEGLHERLRGTRGAAAMLLLIRDNKLEGCGVGNVGIRSYRARIPAMLTPGVLGGSITRLRLFQAEVEAGHRIILFSDGISSRFDDEGARGAPPLATCTAIMERYRKPHDDATVLVTDIEAREASASQPKPSSQPKAGS
jgi:negative regulator of sigma-B (phosphoserine phosphatase)